MWLSWIGLRRRPAGRLLCPPPAGPPRALAGAGGGATAVAAGLLAGVDDPWQIVWKGWPLVLVAIGVALVARALTDGASQARGGGPPAVR